MIVKTFEINKKKIDKQNLFLVYGENEGLKSEIIQNLKKNYSIAPLLKKKFLINV